MHRLFRQHQRLKQRRDPFFISPVSITPKVVAEAELCTRLVPTLTLDMRARLLPQILRQLEKAGIQLSSYDLDATLAAAERTQRLARIRVI